MKQNNYLSVVAIILALVAIGICAMTTMTKSTTDVENVLNERPEIIINALQMHEVRAQEEAAKAAREMMAGSIEEINNDINSPFVGPEKAKVTLAMFYDYSCGYCHRLFPVLKSVAANNPDVKFVFKPLDFLGDISHYTAKAVFAVTEQGKFEEFNNALFAYEGQLNEEAVDEIAAELGVDIAKMKKSMETTAQANLSKTSQLAQKIQIRGVPTMVLNGAPLQTFDAEEIQSKIDSLK